MAKTKFINQMVQLKMEEQTRLNKLAIKWSEDVGTVVTDNTELNKGEQNKMATLGEEASQYEPPTTKNITDLKVISTSFQLEDRTGKDKDNKEFKYKVIVVDGEEYRVPNPVLGSLKAILEKKPDLKEFSVSKTGSNLDTRYTVIPL